MKKSRLLEIIREEISSTLSEVPFPDGPLDIKNPEDISTSPEERSEKPLQDAIKNAVDILKAEFPNLTNDDLAKLVTKVNSDKNRQADKNIKQNTSDGETLEIAADSQIGKDYKAALNAIADTIEDQAEIYQTNKIDGLISQKGVDAKTVERLEKLKEKGYTYTLGFPQTLKAVERAVGGGATKKATAPKAEKATATEPKAEKATAFEPKGDSLSDLKDEVAKVTTNMKDLAKKFSKAEGEEKEDLKNQLKDLNKKKKELEKELEKQL
jgi:uncharacterized protein involved in exopolysaccharide biosynthesis